MTLILKRNFFPTTTINRNGGSIEYEHVVNLGNVYMLLVEMKSGTNRPIYHV